MNDQDEKPAFIVDPDGTVYDVRKKKDSQGSSSSNIPPREPPTNKSYSRPTPKPTGNLSINPIGLILFVISIIFFVARSVIYVQVSRNTPTRPAGYSYYSMGNNYYSQGRHEEAITQYNLAIKMDPDFGEAYNNRGLVYMDTGKYEEARADFEKAIEYMPDDATPYSNLGAIYLGIGDLSNAIQSLDKAIELDPSFGKAYYNRGLTYLEMEEYDLSISDFTKAIEVIPEEITAPLGKLATANPTVRSLIPYAFSIKEKQLYFDLHLAYSNRGLAFLFKGEHGKAFADLDKAVELRPDLSIVYYNRGLANYYVAEYDKAISDLEKAVELNNAPNIQDEALYWLNELMFYSDPMSFDEDDAVSGYDISNEGIYGLALDPATPDTIYAGMEDGVVKSLNGGETWTLINNGLIDTDVRSLIVDPEKSTTLYAGTFASGVFKSRNGGDSWSQAGIEIADRGIQSLVIDPTMPSTLYAGTYGGEVFKSINGGDNWKLVNSGITGTSMFSLVIDPDNPSTVYAGATDGLFRTVNGGESWDFIGLEVVLTVAIDPVIPNTIYAGALDGFYRSSDDGENWTQINEGLPENIYITALTIDPFMPSNIYAGGLSIYKSTDRGDSWHEIDTTSPIPPLRVLALDPASPVTLYAGMEFEGVYIIYEVDKK